MVKMDEDCWTALNIKKYPYLMKTGCWCSFIKETLICLGQYFYWEGIIVKTQPQKERTKLFEFYLRERFNVATVAMFNTQNVTTVGMFNTPI